MVKDDKEKLNELNRKYEQSKARLKVTEKRCNLAERNARTRRLVQIGATVEHVYGGPVAGKKLEALEHFLQQQEVRGNFLSRALNAAESSDK